MKHIYVVWEKGHEQEAQWYLIKDNDAFMIPGLWWKQKRRLGIIKTLIFLLRIKIDHFVNQLVLH